MSLNNKTLIFGTMEREDVDPSHESMTAAVSTALELGYRHFDMAEIYTTQAAVGRALSASTVRREELFLINKLDGLPTTDYSNTKHRVLQMLKQVGVEYFDLLLIHYPLPSGTGAATLSGDPSLISTEDMWRAFSDTLAVAWQHLSLLQHDGLVKHVGLSNCYVQHLEALSALISAPSPSEEESGAGAVETRLAPIYAIQNYMDAAHHEADLLDYCQHHHIHCLAYRPVVFMSVYGLLEGVLEELQEVARKQGLESAHQLVLYWLLRRGVCPIVSSVDKAHMVTNYATEIKYKQFLLHEASSSPQGGEIMEEAAAAGSSLSVIEETMQKLSAQTEMIDMLGGSDEYARAFKEMGE